MPHCYSTISNMRQYGQQLQNQILLFYYIFLSPLPQISITPSTLSHFFSLCHSLSLLSPPYSRKLLKITLQSSPRSCRLILQPSLPTSTAFTADLQISLKRVVSVRFGMGFDVGFRLALCGLWVEVLGRLGWGFRPIIG